MIPNQGSLIDSYQYDDIDVSNDQIGNIKPQAYGKFISYDSEGPPTGYFQERT